MNGGIDEHQDVTCEESSVQTRKIHDLEKVTEGFFKALNAPERFRLRIIKIIFPEIMEAAKVLREFYWK